MEKIYFFDKFCFNGHQFIYNTAPPQKKYKLELKCKLKSHFFAMFFISLYANVLKVLLKTAKLKATRCASRSE